MIRVSYDFRTPVWHKFGGVVYVERAEDIAAAIRAQSGEVEVTHCEQRPATQAEARRHQRYLAWAVAWRAAASRAEAGRHMFGPLPEDEQWRRR